MSPANCSFVGPKLSQSSEPCSVGCTRSECGPPGQPWTGEQGQARLRRALDCRTGATTGCRRVRKSGERESTYRRSNSPGYAVPCMAACTLQARCIASSRTRYHQAGRKHFAAPEKCRASSTRAAVLTARRCLTTVGTGRRTGRASVGLIIADYLQAAVSARALACTSTAQLHRRGLGQSRIARLGVRLFKVMRQIAAKTIMAERLFLRRSGGPLFSPSRSTFWECRQICQIEACCVRERTFSRSFC